MIRRLPRSTHCIPSAASDVYKRQVSERRWKVRRRSTLNARTSTFRTPRRTPIGYGSVPGGLSG
eukprot:11863345-Alexandrium_andersonii.AAC.1